MLTEILHYTPTNEATDMDAYWWAAIAYFDEQCAIESGYENEFIVGYLNGRKS